MDVCTGACMQHVYVIHCVNEQAGLRSSHSVIFAVKVGGIAGYCSANGFCGLGPRYEATSVSLAAVLSSLIYMEIQLRLYVVDNQ
jgi:hypothetical protein